jgi:RND family efflux transporter MFP subunit
MRIILISLAAAALAACGSHPPPTPAAELPARSVALARAEKQLRPTVEEVVGTVRARSQATIAAITGGKIAEVKVTVGSRVRAGDVLVRITAREAAARVAQAGAVLALARLERDRMVALREKEVATAAQLDQAQSQLRVAEATYAEARTLADHAVLRAPFDGVVTAKLAQPGDTAMPGQGLLVVEAPAVLRFEARVPESRAQGLALGQPAAVRLDGETREQQGTIGEIDPAADAATRTVLVKVDLPADPALRSGRFGRLLLTRGNAEAIVAPAGAVVRRGQLELVFVVDAGVARLRLVRTGRAAGDGVEIISGLEGGETLAASEAALLVDGQKVEVAL